MIECMPLKQANEAEIPGILFQRSNGLIVLLHTDFYHRFKKRVSLFLGRDTRRKQMAQTEPRFTAVVLLSFYGIFAKQ